MAGMLEKVVELTAKHDKLVIQRMQAERKLDALKGLQLQRDHAGKQLKAAFNAADENFKKHKEAARQLKAKAEAAAPLTHEMKLLFQQLPGTMEELEEALEEAKAQVEMNAGNANPKIIEEYEKRCEEVSEMPWMNTVV